MDDRLLKSIRLSLERARRSKFKRLIIHRADPPPNGSIHFDVWPDVRVKQPA